MTTSNPGFFQVDCVNTGAGGGAQRPLPFPGRPVPAKPRQPPFRVSLRPYAGIPQALFGQPGFAGLG